MVKLPTFKHTVSSNSVPPKAAGVLTESDPDSDFVTSSGESSFNDSFSAASSGSFSNYSVAKDQTPSSLNSSFSTSNMPQLPTMQKSCKKTVVLGNNMKTAAK